MKLTITILLCIISFYSPAQLLEDFSDGDFSSNPSWTGTTNDFIINSSQQLQTNSPIAATSYLATPHQLSDLNDKEWKFYVRMGFAGSATNFVRIYLTSDSPDLTAVSNGYYIHLGEAGSNDAIRLFKLENGTSTQLLATANGSITNSANAGIRVVRSAGGSWSLESDLSGGTNYQSSGTVSDPSVLTGTYFGIITTYTASNIKKVYLDDIYAGDEIIDVIPPSLASYTIINPFELELTFSEPIEATSIETVSNYSFTPSLSLSGVEHYSSALQKAKLSFSSSFINGTTYSFSIQNVTDLNGNSTTIQDSFTYLVAESPIPGDIIISEVMVDPSPVVGLPEVEFVEIYNRSSKYFNLTGWKLGDNTSDGTISSGWMYPGEYKVLCSNANGNLFPGASGVTSIPSFNNDSDDVVLKDPSGTIIDKITYYSSWYRNDAKKEGGYTLERINLFLPCSDENNWTASIAPAGGTPSGQNSVYSNSPDTLPPYILTTNATSGILIVQFNEGIDSTLLMNLPVLFTPPLTVLSRSTVGSHPSFFRFSFAEIIQPSTMYKIHLTGISDCSGNTTNLIGEFILADSIFPGDIVVNEILFNPLTGGSDFIELKNISDKIIDAGTLLISNLRGTSSSTRKIPLTRLLTPGELIVLTSDSLFQLQHYPVAIPGTFIQMPLPSFNNDSSTVALLRASDTFLIDKVSYTEKWHFKLIDDVKGKSLEKIDPNGSADNAQNWHTAAESIGFASPGAENSHYSPYLESGSFSFSSESFSPDNDGYEDFLQINYHMTEPGMVASVTIFDDRGIIVKRLVKNELLGINGSFIWDGINEDNRKAAIGIYIVLFEAFNISSGTSFAKRKVCVLAGKL